MFLPKKKPDIVALDRLDIELVVSGASQVQIAPVYRPDLTGDLCPCEPAVSVYDVEPSYRVAMICPKPHCSEDMEFAVRLQQIGTSCNVTCPACGEVSQWTPIWDNVIQDLSSWLEESAPYPPIEDVSFVLAQPGVVGKAYRRVEIEPQQPRLLVSEEDEKLCVHGLKKRFCATCREKDARRRERKKGPKWVDPFDLILPVLQPPLGENLDSPLAFAPDQELDPFQRTGVKFLVEHPIALLGDEMGLGKSIQAIVALRVLSRRGAFAKALILCPKSVLGDWDKKLWEWAPEFVVQRVHGPRDQRELLWKSPAHIYLTTYETLREDLFRQSAAATLQPRQFDLAILDEIQKIKTPSAGVTKASRMIQPAFRWGLSGTPLENRLEELISVFAYLKPGLLHYEDAAAPSRVSKRIKDYVLRRRKADVLPELPEKRREDVWLELTPAQRAAYDRAEQTGKVQLDGMGETVTVQHVFALIAKLKQICNMEPVSRESCKLEYLTERLEELCEQDDKALVFSQYPEKTLEHLVPQLKEFNAKVFKGSLSSGQRDELIREFQEEEACKVLLLSTKAGGTGITLTRANYVFHYDLWWNPAVAAQAEDRSHRKGQAKTVFVTSLLTLGTIEEDIQAILAAKQRLFNQVVDSLSDTDLSNVLTEEDLFSLFDLKKVRPKRSPVSPLRGVSPSTALDRLTPQEFEQLTAQLFERMGYHVKLTPMSRDQGVDVYAKRITTSGTEYLAIQCKHYPNGVVGVEHVRALYGVIEAKQEITKGILVTSGLFSTGCKEFASNKRLELFDGAYLTGLLEKHQLSV